MTKILRGLLAASVLFLVAQSTHAADTNTPAQTLTLHDCVNIALDQNPSILKAKEEILRTKGVLLEARAPGIPQVNALGSYEAIQKSGIDAFPSTNTIVYGNQEQPWSAQVQISQLLYAGGRVASSVHAAKLSQQIAAFGFQSTVADTILEVRIEFYLILSEQALVEVRQQSIALLEKQLGEARSRYDVGSVPRFTVLQAEVAVANARPPLIRAQNDLRLTKESLVKLLAIDTSTQTNGFTQIKFDGQLIYEPKNWDLPTALQQAISQRPELQQAERQVGVAKDNVKVASSGYKPQASVFGNYGWHDDTFSDNLDQTHEGWTVGVNFNWALFDGMLTRGRVTQTRSQLQDANIDYADTRRVIELEVRRAYSDYLQALELFEAQKKTVEQAEESLRLAEARFNPGTDTQLDVLSAQEALTEARSNEIQALYDYNAAVARLERSTGMMVSVAN